MENSHSISSKSHHMFLCYFCFQNMLIDFDDSFDEAMLIARQNTLKNTVRQSVLLVSVC